jgi:hypothetical protein
MATFTWVGGGSNDFTDPALWNPGTVPSTGDTLIIPASKTVNFVPASGSLTLPLSNNITNVAATADHLNYVDVVSNGGALTSGNGAAFGDFVWNITDSTHDAATIVLGSFAQLNLTGSTSNSM